MSQHNTTTVQETITNICDYIPHRFENLLVDSLDLYETGSDVYDGILSLLIQKNDPLKRDLFFKQKKENDYVLSSVLHMEVAALGSVLVCGKVPEDKLAYFVSISNFSYFQDLGYDMLLQGGIKQLKSRTGFYRFQVALGLDTALSEGQIMAAIAPIEMPSDKEIECHTLPQKQLSLAHPKSPELKDPCMYMVDELTAIDLEKGSLVTTYHFPDDHPLIKGHFPNKPVFMGVLQWMGIEDSCFMLASYLFEKEQKTGAYQISLDGSIYNQHGHLVAELKQVTVQIYYAHAPYLNQAEIIATKKVIFKGMVFPNDTLTYVIDNLTFL